MPKQNSKYLSQNLVVQTVVCFPHHEMKQKSTQNTNYKYCGSSIDLLEVEVSAVPIAEKPTQLCCWTAVSVGFALDSAASNTHLA